MIVSAFSFFVLPPLMEQVSDLWKNLPNFKNQLAKQLEGGSLPSRIILPFFDLPRSPEFDAWLAKPLAWGPRALEVVAGLLIAVVLSLYLLLDGRKVVAWLLAYVPRAHRRRMGKHGPGGVRGRAGVHDRPDDHLRALFALHLRRPDDPPCPRRGSARSFCRPLRRDSGGGDHRGDGGGIALCTDGQPSAALSVLGIYLCYHLFEAYVLVPRLYGNRMRLSTLTVLLAILAGGTLGGVIGAVLSLPIVAAYPVFEKHWLDDYMHPDAVEDHLALRDTDGKESEAVVDAVMQGATPGK